VTTALNPRVDPRLGREGVFEEGFDGAAANRFRTKVRAEIEAGVAPLVATAERERSFPRAAVERLGAAGIFRERWAGGDHGDPGRSVLLAEELGRAGVGGVGVGISLHLEAALGILGRFARDHLSRAHAEAALDGRELACVATSEQRVGSDLRAVETELVPTTDGWHIKGRKWFVSPGGKADFAIVLCRTQGPERKRGIGADPLALAIVPRSGLRVEKVLETTGMRSLETVRLSIDAQLPADAVLGRPGLGLAAVSFGLTHERLAIAAQTLGGAELALDLTTTHLHRRRQFGARLIEHQALRLRLAELSAQVRLARLGVYGVAATLPSNSTEAARLTAGAKVTAARLAEHVLGECIHLFGGSGYVEDETPLARLWRDVRIGRLGAGSDEVMWELVARGLRPNERRYDKVMAVSR
jgi:alkylation response protein AidB-like acyl-CoA dehydrogenase